MKRRGHSSHFISEWRGMPARRNPRMGGARTLRRWQVNLTQSASQKSLRTRTHASKSNSKFQDGGRWLPDFTLSRTEIMIRTPRYDYLTSHTAPGCQHHPPSRSLISSLSSLVCLTDENDSEGDPFKIFRRSHHEFSITQFRIQNFAIHAVCVDSFTGFPLGHYQ